MDFSSLKRNMGVDYLVKLAWTVVMAVRNPVMIMTLSKQKSFASSLATRPSVKMAISAPGTALNHVKPYAERRWKNTCRVATSSASHAIYPQVMLHVEINVNGCFAAVTNALAFAETHARRKLVLRRQQNPTGLANILWRCVAAMAQNRVQSHVTLS